jgi:hypothetical protein
MFFECMRPVRQILAVALLGLTFTAIHSVAAPSPALASKTQLAMIEEGTHLLSDPQGTLATFRKLGAGIVRVIVPWSEIAPSPSSRKRPSKFDATNPAAYPAAKWSIWDTIVSDAKADGIAIDFTVAGGAPRWADGAGIPSAAANNPNRAWEPSAREYGMFVHALGTRYSGRYDPTTHSVSPGSPNDLPAVKFWAIWNEPNFGEDLAPQAIKGSTVSVAPGMYRGLVDAAWSALHATGHGNDTIVFGELAARGLSGKVTHSHPEGLPGDFSQTKPLQFIRTLYCVDSSFRELRGSAARALGCPSTASASQRFRSQHPGLFQASGVGDHPYPQNQPPTKESSTDPDFAAFPELPKLEAQLDRLQRTYGSGKHLTIYNDEYGYITNPPNRGKFVSPATAAYYINWAEYLSWRSSRIGSTMQFLLYDPSQHASLPEFGGFASGLLTYTGKQKPAYSAYRLPLYLPVTSTRRGRSLEVWGDVRPAHYAAIDTGAAQSAKIQFQRGSRGSFTTLKTLNITDPRGYFDTHVTFPASGTVRLIWTYPTGDALLPAGSAYSRHVQVTVH